VDANPSDVAVPPARHPVDLVGLTIFAAAGIAVYLRLFYGLDLTDDSFYVGLPYAFALGHRPFVDELATHQFAGLLLLPAVKAYLGVVGSNTGLVLFARHLYFAASLSSALLARDTLSEIFGRRAGNLAAASSLGFIPFLLPSLSYNTIACLGMLAGTMLLASACLPGRSPMRLGFGVVCVALASFAYPPVLVAAIVALLLGLAGFCFVRESELRRKAFIIVSAAGLSAGAAALALIHQYDGFAQLERLADLNAAFAVQGGGLEKLSLILGEFVLQSHYLIALLAVSFVVLSGVRWIRQPRAAAAAAALIGPALLAVEFLFYLPHREPFTTVPFVLMALGVFSPVGVWLVRGRLSRNECIALLVISVSSITGAAIVLWATANGLRNAALGILPAYLVTLGCIALLRPRNFPRSSFVFAAFAASLLVFQIFQIWTHVYRDRPIWELTTTIDRGAWSGIRTTEAKKTFVETFEDDLAKARGDAKTVLFMDYFPAGYLLSDLRPRTPAIWLFPWNKTQQGNRAIREVYARGFPDPASLPDILVLVNCFPTHSMLSIPLQQNDPVALRMVEGNYQRAITRDCYVISKPRQVK